MLELKPGALARVKIPTALSRPFSEFHPNWVAFAEAQDEKLVRLDCIDHMFHAPDGCWSEEMFTGWKVKETQQAGKIRAGVDCASWLPSEWLVIAEEQLSLWG